MLCLNASAQQANRWQPEFIAYRYW